MAMHAWQHLLPPLPLPPPPSRRRYSALLQVLAPTHPQQP